jgi:uridine phosphorylase
MKTADAVYEYIRTEVIPHIAGESEMTAAIMSGALRARKQQITQKLANSEVIQSLGFFNEKGEVDKAAAEEFAAGMFEGRDSISISVAELVKMATGFESNSILLQDKLKFSKADIDKFISMLG